MRLIIFLGTWNPDASTPQPGSHSRVNFDKLIENIRELNAIAGEGEAQIEKTKGGARFKVSHV